MKPCAYCGKENDDAAVLCAECGTGSFKSTTDNAIERHTHAEIHMCGMFNDPVRLFRALVVISTVTYTIYFFQFLVAGRFFSPETWNAISWYGYGALLPPMPPGFNWLFLLVSTAVAIGLWTFSKSARWVFVAFCAYGIVTALLGGIQVHTGFSCFLLLICNLADGAILVMAYTAPLKEKFE